MFFYDNIFDPGRGLNDFGRHHGGEVREMLLELSHQPSLDDARQAIPRFLTPRVATDAALFTIGEIVVEEQSTGRRFTW